MKLEGKKFGRLTVLEKDLSKGDSNHPYWKCQCQCGKIKSIRQDLLKSGKTQSCGCLAKELARQRILEDDRLAGHNFQDLSGKKFGNLTVLKLIEKGWTSTHRFFTLYECKCNCGNIIQVEGGNLRSFHTTSCGCKKDSLGVSELTLILNKLNIKYEKEKIFQDCRSDKNYPLRMDFYLPDYNTVIEVDGQQHFYKEPNGYFTQEAINRIKELDNIKNNYCKNNNIKMIRIPYYNWKKLNIEYVKELLEIK